MQQKSAIRYTTLLHCALYLYCVAVLLLYFAIGDNRLVNIYTVTLDVAMVAALSLMVAVPHKRSAEVRVAFASFAALFMLPGVPGYMLYPVNFPFGGMDWARVAVDDVNRALVFIVFGILAALGGFIAGSYVAAFVPRAERATPAPISARRLALIGIAFVALELYVGIRFSRFSTDVSTEEGAFYLMRLFSSDAVLIVCLVLLAYRWTLLRRSERMTLIATAILIVVHKTLVGSRAGLFVLLMLFFVIMLDRFGDFRLSRRAVTIVFVAAAGTLIAFPVATIVRDYWLLSSRVSYRLSLAEFWRDRAAGEGGHDPTPLLRSFFARLNGLDPVATIATGHSRDYEQYVSLTNDVKSFINIITPGTPFPEALERSKTFAIVYRGYPEVYLQNTYVTWMWTIWGDCYGLFGFSGGLLWMLFLCALFSAGFAVLARIRLRGSTYVRVSYLFFTYTFVTSFGLDTFAADMVYYLLPLFVVLALAGEFTSYMFLPFRYLSTGGAYLARHVTGRVRLRIVPR